MLPIVISLSSVSLTTPLWPFSLSLFISFCSSRNKSKSSCLALAKSSLPRYPLFYGKDCTQPSDSNGFDLPHPLAFHRSDCRFQFYIFIEEKTANVTSDLPLFASFTPSQPYPHHPVRFSQSVVLRRRLQGLLPRLPLIKTHPKPPISIGSKATTVYPILFSTNLPDSPSCRNPDPCTFCCTPLEIEIAPLQIPIAIQFLLSYFIWSSV